ncbi:MAG: hypothetical protein ABMA64_21755 [Myxococcota bacterium]
MATCKLEAEATTGPGRGALLAAAGRITVRRLNDPSEAERLLTAAIAAGDATAETRRTLAEVRGTQGRYTEQEQAWLELARVSAGVDRSEAYLEAALIAWRRRDRPAEAVAYLREATAALPEDFTSRALLRALMPAVGSSSLNERIDLLEELARLAEGGIAADARVEQAALAEEARRTDLARMAYNAALDAEPGHTFAFQRLERSLQDDPAGLAQLYDREAARPGQTSPGWWRVKAARAWLAAGRGDAAVEGFTAAVDAGYGFALRELQGTYLRVGAHRELEVVLARESAALGANEGRGAALFRLGWLREAHLSDPAGALEAYREALGSDPAASPAADAVLRLIPDAERAEFLVERARKVADIEEKRALQLWAAELAESRQDWDSARSLYEQVAESSSGVESELARDGLDRVLQRANDPAALARLRQARAETTADTNDRVAWLLLAGSAPADRALAVQVFSGALDQRADQPAALAAVVVGLEEAGRHDDLVSRLRAAGNAATDPARRASYLFRAAQVLARHGSVPGEAITCAELALVAEPRLRTARWLIRRIRTGRSGEAEAASYREQAKHTADLAGRLWARFAASVLAGSGPDARADLEAILGEQPDHAGAVAAYEVQLVAERDRAGLVSLYRRAIDSATGLAGARLATRSAELLIETGRNDEAGLVLRRLRGVPGAPLRVGARLALAIGSTERAIDLLSGSDAEEDRVERARLLASAGRGPEALQLLLELLGTASDRVGVAARVATVAQQVGDPEAMIKGYATLAQKARSDSLRAAYGAWTGMQLQAANRHADALEYWQIARRHRPQSTQALLGVVRGLVARKERAKIQPAFADAPKDLAPIAADALVSLGDVEGAADVLTSYAAWLAQSSAQPERQLSALLEVERLLGSVADWQGTHDALVMRRRLCRSPVVIEQAEAATRWILSEELPESDAAWTLFRELHAERPGDRQVTDALARIASARGEVDVGIGYLRELADTAPDPKEAARLRRRIGEVFEGVNRTDDARQAYLDALDHQHDDRDALEGLRRLAQANKDWPGLVAVLQREAASADRSRQIELRRQIARVTEDRIGDRKVAIDAWRGLLELDPANREGLDHLLKLAEEQGAWALYVETGEALARQLTGREQATLLRKLGVACQDRLGRDDAARLFEQAVATLPPDAEAATRLEAIARNRADWPAAVRALRLQAAADVPADVKVNALLRAARVEIEALHDKESAARSYRQVLELRPDETSALKFMATHLFDAKKYDEALPICERLEPQLANDDDLDDFDTRIELSGFYYMFGELMRLRDDEEAAIPRYERALALNPTHLPALESVAPLYSSTAAWDKAERVYRQLLQLSGGQGDKAKAATTYTELGKVERALGSADKAYKRFTKALEIHPNHVGALKGMALILEDRQDWSNLLNVYNSIIYHATAPDDVIDAYMTKGRILDDQMQRQDKAAQHYQRSLDFDPAQPGAYLRLAELAMRRDAYKDAGELVDSALKLDPDLLQSYRPLLLAVKAAAWQDGGHTPEAERCLREVKMLEPSLAAAFGDQPLHDLEALRRAIKDRMPT